MSKGSNIIFILNDHETYYGHGEMAGGPKIHRPNFERLAKEGIEFTRAYTVCPLCGPARRTMLTGLFPHTHGEIINDVNQPFENKTYLEKLAEVGYKNYYYGKWHAGPGTAFDHHCEGMSYPAYNNPYTKPEYKEYLKKHGLPNIQVRITHLFQDPDLPYAKESGLQIGKVYRPNGPGVNEHAAGIMITPKETHEAFFLADLACEKLRELAESGNEHPFHLRVDFWGPHHPYFATQEFLDLYPPETIPEYPNFRDNLNNKPEIYKFDINHPISKNGRLIMPSPLPWSVYQETLALSYAQITLIDKAVGKILDTLEEFGFVENTLVLWSTDHGDALACHGGHFAKASYMPEEMIHVPLVIRYPNMIPAGQKNDKLVSNLDFAPTFLNAAGTSFSKTVQGKSLLPLCSGNDVEWREDLMCETNGCFINYLGRALLKDRYKYVWNYKDMDELYDLKEDPYELTNLIHDEKFFDIIEDMKIRLNKWRRETGDTLTKIKIMKIRRKKIKDGIDEHMTPIF